MKKSLEFSVKFDTAQFDKSVAEMQRKLNELYSPSEQMKSQAFTAQRLQQLGMGGIMGGPNQDALKRSIQQSKKELDSLIKDQAKAQRDLGTLIAQHAQGLEKLIKQQQEMVKGSREELSIQQEISRTKSNSAKLTMEYRQKDAILNQLLDEKQRIMSEDRGRSPISRITEFAKNIGGRGLATGAGAIASGVLGASDIFKFLGQAPIAAASAAGRATQGTFGAELQSAYAGRTPYELAFLPERARAARMAQEATRRVEQTQGLDLGARMLGGAAAGGLAGSFAGPLGVGVGAGIGAIGAGLTNKSVLLSPFSASADKQRQAELAQTFAENFQKALEGEKLQNPLKRMAADEYYQNYTRNLEAQRALGLGYQTFHGPGGFRERAINAGFTDEMAMSGAGGILGAGGSTRMARESVFGLQAQRGFNLTNANQVLGILSGSIGGTASTKQATIDILAEGIRKGFGTDDFAEENRRFVQATAEAVARSGATGQGAISNVVSNFGGFVAEPTTRGIQAAQGAYQAAISGMSQTGGPGGAMRAAGFLRDPDLNKLSSTDRVALMNIPADQIDVDHPVIKDIARRSGVDPSQLVSKVSGVNRGSLHRLGEADKLTERIRGLRKTAQQQGPMEGYQTMQQIAAESAHLQTLVAVEKPELARDRKELASFVEGTTSLKPEDQMKALDRLKTLESKVTGKEEDRTVAAVAESQRIVIENFREFRSDLVQTAEAVNAFNTRLKETIKVAMSMPEAQRMNIFQALFPSQAKSTTQTQAGK